MAIQPVGYRPAQISAPKRLKGNALAIAPGAEVIVASVQLLSMGYPVLESLYYDGSGGGTTFLHFKVTLDGINMADSWADSYNPIGAVGNPAPIGKDLPPGRTVEVRIKNEGAVAFDGFCDGEIYFYAQQPH